MQVEILRDVIARSVARFPEQRSRIERAASMIVLGHVERIAPDAYAVRSESDPAVTYRVTATGCPCVDAQRHPELACKHGWAVDLLLVTAERERRLTAAEAQQAARGRTAADRVALAYARSLARVA